MDDYEKLLGTVTQNVQHIIAQTGDKKVKGTDFEEIVALDVQYIRTCSVWNDIRILYKKYEIIFTGEGAE